jgi:hypothetical protein
MIGVQWDDRETLRDTALFDTPDIREELEVLGCLVTGRLPRLPVVGCDWSLYRALLGAAAAPLIWEPAVEKAGREGREIRVELYEQRGPPRRWVAPESEGMDDCGCSDDPEGR